VSAATLAEVQGEAPRLIKGKPALLSRSPQDTPAGWYNYLLLMLTIVIGSWPVYWAGIISSSPEYRLYQNPPAVTPGDMFMTNYKVVIGDITAGYPSYETVAFESSFRNSLIQVAIVTAGTLFFCSLAGFAFAKLRFRGRDPLFVFVVLTLTIPAQLGIVGAFQIHEALGWIGTLYSITIPGLVSAFGVFYMRQYIEEAVPDELVESARVDGASTFRVYTAIVLPVVRPALGVLGLLTAVSTWNDYLWPLVAVGNSEWQTIGPAMHNLRAGTTPKNEIIMTGSFLATLPLIILLAVAGRQIVRGIMEGAIKA